MAWVFISETHAGNTAGGDDSITLPAPAGISDGDKLILNFATIYSGSNLSDPPSGFTTSGDDYEKKVIGINRTFVYSTKIASGESGSYVIDISGTGNVNHWIAGLAVYRNVDTIDFIAASTITNSTASGTGAVSSGVLHVCMWHGNSTDITADAETTVRWTQDNAGGERSIFADELLSTTTVPAQTAPTGVALATMTATYGGIPSGDQDNWGWK